MFGSFFGAKLSGASKVIQRNLPLCLFSQAGVAIGLSIIAAHLLPESIGNMIIIIVTASTFIVQLIGPSCVKIAITRAGEAGRNVTEEDLLRSIKVDELLDKFYPVIKDNTSVKEILNVKLLHGYHLYWPELDVDLEVDSLENPQQYPLKYK